MDITTPSHVEVTQPLHKFMKYFKFVRPQTNLIMFLVLQPAVIIHTSTHIHMDTQTSTDTQQHTTIHRQGTFIVRLYQYDFLIQYGYRKFYATTNIFKSTNALKLHRPVLLANITYLGYLYFCCTWLTFFTYLMYFPVPI